MLSKNELKRIVKLQQKKHREREGLILIEGLKMVEEARNSEMLEALYVTESMAKEVEALGLEFAIASEDQIKRLSSQSTSSGIIGLATMPKWDLNISSIISSPMLLLDGIRDPGNLGTIIRTAEWFGVSTIICSVDCVDVFNPKVIQSTMGSLFRLPVHVTELPNFIESVREVRPELKFLATTLDGDVISGSENINANAIIIGSESHGVSDEVLKACTGKIRIPGGNGVESLNAAIAAGIILYQWLSPQN